MLRNYPHHTQSPKSSVHRVHKMQGKAIWQILKSCDIVHRLWNHGSSLTFVKSALADHFFPREWLMQSTWLRWSALIGYVHGGSLSAGLSGLSGLVSDV
jgi:hypothetical protein